ncbi:tyrosine-type recombinase/integrase [Paenibacillus peoriae]|nr:tyrosine-type recombinase/integrase [Paenibacillus peoriae]
MYFLSKTGLRISEALALRWENIDGDKTIIIIKQTSRGPLSFVKQSKDTV